MQNSTACVQLYFINCMLNSSNSCVPVMADYCTSLPLSILCVATTACYWANSTCKDCLSQPCFSQGERPLANFSDD